MGLTREAIQRMRDAVGDDDLVIADILQSFVDEVGSLSDQLTTAAAAMDVKALHRIAHTLKSSCRDLGDGVTGDLCAKLEADARAGEVADAATAAKAINARLRDLRSEVAAYLSAS
ncbi:Hpt domain-containing protein [Paragemmobacter straminiformis]|uniref:Hpt domain-containing protein n=1 Tax=Paragemmobacter straminiformis TaxID=2045119 RepID=A0A842I2L9_9RHOB|nr:Hpt domain-containing protein [Gemmobacter straminiformis]MBC2834036.1 Hpt domain-containing protein [Gemmobacter straminiformis]